MSVINHVEAASQLSQTCKGVPSHAVTFEARESDVAFCVLALSIGEPSELLPLGGWLSPIANPGGGLEVLSDRLHDLWKRSWH